MLSPLKASDWADASGLKAGAERGKNGNVTVTASIDIGNPFTLRPQINASFSLTFAPDGSFVGGTARNDGFPAYEIYATHENGDTDTIYQSSPEEQGCSAMCLLPGVGGKGSFFGPSQQPSHSNGEYVDADGTHWSGARSVEAF